MDLSKIVQHAGLGRILYSAEAVSGGLMHKMYRAETEKGTFALKMLNPEIMRRPTALKNITAAEKAAHACEGKLPIIAAMMINGRQVQCFENQYYMVFPWFDGKSIFPPHIHETHCRKIGNALGMLHGLNMQVDGLLLEEKHQEMTDWQEIIHDLPEADWADRVKCALPELIEKQEKAEHARETLSQYQVISHRDLDPKNVLWNDEDFAIIDWEAAGYVNPWQELAENIFYWTDDGKGGLNQALFTAFYEGYRQWMDVQNAPLEAAFHASSFGTLEWLYYNVRRALGREAASEEERQLGIRQVHYTLDSLQGMDAKIGLALVWIKEI